tara:strand:+ start:508 stop:648 length:141 start_codon:yes stop_codon:yes gene_type:complete
MYMDIVVDPEIERYRKRDRERQRYRDIEMYRKIDIYVERLRWGRNR